MAMGILGEDFMGWMAPKDSSSVTLLPSQVLQPCVTLNRGKRERKRYKTLPFCDTDGNYATFPSRQDSKSLKSERCRRNLTLSEEELDASINLKLDVVVFQ